MTYSEEWKDIKGFEGRYQISNFGRVKSLARNQKYRNRKMPERIIVQGNRPNNYLFVTLYNEAKRNIVSIHRLVAQAFIPNPLNLKTVNHKDFNRQNNKVKNLEWCTQAENVRHAIIGNRANFAVGERQHNSKLKDYQVLDILNSSELPKSLCIKYKVSPATISQIRNRKIWKHIS